MDGYSINEAAAVLGIPEGRVWELLARGVLAGSSEVGGDMRVFLRGTALVEAPHQTDSGSNGSNGESNGHGELSPFRELLTEFRNLTERYGQALLALGESRGEVASLRGRVDLLEARLDQRVPWSAASPPRWAAPVAESEAAAYEAPAVTASNQESEAEMKPVGDTKRDGEPEVPSEPEPPQGAEQEPSSESDSQFQAESEPIVEAGIDGLAGAEELTAEGDAETKRARSAARSRSRSAISGFAEALARAEDPTSASVGAEFVDPDDLPGARETADAVAAYRRETMGDSDLAALLIEPEAEVEPSPVVRAGYTTDTPEPDWIAEEDLIVPGGTDVSEVEGLAEPATVSAADAADDEWARDEPAMDDTPALEAANVEIEEPAEPTKASAQVEVEGLVKAVEPIAPTEPTLAPEQNAAIEPVDVVEPIESLSPTEPIDASVGPITPAEPAEPDIAAPAVEVEEPELPVVAALEIAAEPPASDDVALLVGPAAFAEPPIVPPEPAFWEPKARERAPFAVDAWGVSDGGDPADAWDARDTQEAPATEARPGPTLTAVSEAPPPLADPAPPLADPAPPLVEPAQPAAAPQSEASEAPGWLEIPPPSVGVPRLAEAEEAKPTTMPPGVSRPSRPSSRRRRGAAARAIRRLRLLLD